MTSRLPSTSSSTCSTDRSCLGPISIAILQGRACCTRIICANAFWSVTLGNCSVWSQATCKIVSKWSSARSLIRSRRTTTSWIVCSTASRSQLRSFRFITRRIKAQKWANQRRSSVSCLPRTMPLNGTVHMRRKLEMSCLPMMKSFKRKYKMSRLAKATSKSKL